MLWVAALIDIARVLYLFGFLLRGAEPETRLITKKLNYIIASQTTDNIQTSHGSLGGF